MILAPTPVEEIVDQIDDTLHPDGCHTHADSATLCRIPVGWSLSVYERRSVGGYVNGRCHVCGMKACELCALEMGALL